MLMPQSNALVAMRKKCALVPRSVIVNLLKRLKGKKQILIDKYSSQKITSFNPGRQGGRLLSALNREIGIGK